MTITRTGSNEKYASNWESIFGKTKASKATVSPAAKKKTTQKKKAKKEVSTSLVSKKSKKQAKGKAKSSGKKG